MSEESARPPFSSCAVGLGAGIWVADHPSTDSPSSRNLATHLAPSPQGALAPSVYRQLNRVERAAIGLETVVVGCFKSIGIIPAGATTCH